MDVLVRLMVTSTKLKYLTKLLLARVNKRVIFDLSIIHLPVTLHTWMSGCMKPGLNGYQMDSTSCVLCVLK
jgi:hypothetical protein